LDAGPKTTERLIGVMQSAKTLIWNGPLGVFEIAPFDAATVAAAKAAALFKKMSSSAVAMAQQPAVAVVLDIFVKNLSTRLFVVVSAQYSAVVITMLAEEKVKTWAALPEAVALNYNVVILKALDMLLGEACVSADSGIKVLAAGAVTTTTKVAMLDLLGSILDVCPIGVFSKITDHNLNATNGTTSTACAAAAVKVTVLQTAPVIDHAAIGIKVHDWP
jgi:hypothetical protein